MTIPDLIRKSLDIHGGTQTSFAKECGVSQGLISQFLCGVKKPGWKTCQKIEAITGGEVNRYHLRPDIFGEKYE